MRLQKNKKQKFRLFAVGTAKPVCYQTSSFYAKMGKLYNKDSKCNFVNDVRLKNQKIIERFIVKHFKETPKPLILRALKKSDLHR